MGGTVAAGSAIQEEALIAAGAGKNVIGSATSAGRSAEHAAAVEEREAREALRAASRCSAGHAVVAAGSALV